MSLTFNEEEDQVGNKLLDVMYSINDWGLRANNNELVQAIHTIQMFIFQHALQRTGGINGEWYNK